MSSRARHPEGWQVGRLAGVPVVLARSWFVAAAVIVLFFGPTVTRLVPGVSSTTAYAVAFGYALLLLVSVLVHELAHALAARATGLPATRIVITLWGGHTQFEAESSTPGRSFLVAVVGPLSNALLAVPAGLAAAALPRGSLLTLTLFAVAITNAFVAAFNLVPGLPLDGGRLLEALVWRVTGNRHTGTVVAGWGGRLAAVALVLWAVSPVLRGEQPSLLRVVWAALLGALLWSGAGQAIRSGTLRRRAPQADVDRLALPVSRVPASASLAEAVTASGARGPRDLDDRPVLLLGGDDGAAVAVLDPEAVAAVPAERWPVVPATSAARALPAGARVPAGLAGDGLLSLLGSLPGREWVVVDAGGLPVGLLRGEDVVAAVMPAHRGRR